MESAVTDPHWLELPRASQRKGPVDDPSATVRDEALSRHHAAIGPDLMLRQFADSVMDGVAAAERRPESARPQGLYRGRAFLRETLLLSEADVLALRNLVRPRHLRHPVNP